MAGRNPVPLALNKKHFTNEEKSRRLNAEERLRGNTDAIKPPTWLDTAAKKEFRRLAKELAALDIIQNTDIGGLAIACDAYSKYIMATSAITETTINTQLTKTDGGVTVKKVPLSAVDKYATIYRQYCSEYGLTPAARIKLAAVLSSDKQEDKSPMAIYLSKRAGAG